MKIGIDARFVGPQGTGLGKYAEKLILNLAKIDNKNEYVIFLKENNWDYLPFLNHKNFTKVSANIPWYSFAEQIKLPKIFASQKLDLLHVPHFNVPIFYRGKFVVTIHDLIHHHFQEQSATTRNQFVFKTKRFAYKSVIAHAIKKSAKIIVPSNFVKGQIIETFRINPEKAIVTYEAAEEEYSSSHKSQVTSQQLLKKFKITKPFIIYVGNAYPHKNLERLLEAFKILTTSHQLPTTNLVIVCPRDVFWQRLQDQIASQELQDQVITTGYIPPKELASIASQAKAYVFPSLSEGFGIPGLNAMAAGIPVVCSDIPTLKEVYGYAALYFDPADPSDIAAKINRVISNTKIRSALIDSGYKQVQKYSWPKMAKETLKIYQSIIN